MAVLGLSYAAYAAITASALVFINPGDDQQGGDEWMVTYGHAKTGNLIPKHDGFVSIESRPKTQLPWNFKPVYAAGFSESGAAYATVAVRKDFHIGPVQITPFIGPALYQREFASNWDSRELLQFRTGVDLLVPLTKDLKIGAGFYHLSNAKMNDQSADIDVTHVTLQYKF